MQKLVVLLIVALLSACSVPEYHDGWISGVKRGQKIRDLRTVPKHSTDLRELSLSLPILESRDSATLDVYYELSEAAPDKDVWHLPADGAQIPVTVTRLPNDANGLQKIRLSYSHVRDGNYAEFDSYETSLKRLEGEWEVTDHRKK